MFNRSAESFAFLFLCIGSNRTLKLCFTNFLRRLLTNMWTFPEKIQLTTHNKAFADFGGAPHRQPLISHGSTMSWDGQHDSMLTPEAEVGSICCSRCGHYQATSHPIVPFAFCSIQILTVRLRTIIRDDWTIPCPTVQAKTFPATRSYLALSWPAITVSRSGQVWLSVFSRQGIGDCSG